jgi:internalin A
VDTGMTVYAWDFGGQEVYRITHQFFFTQRALYLVVWKPREGQEQNEVEPWLRRIRLRVGREARVLVVATHCAGERHPDLDYPHLRRIFPELLVGHFESDSKTGRGIAELRRAIAGDVAAFPQMGQLLSPRWIQARDEILGLADTEPQISFKRFAHICSSYGLEDEETNTLADLLHILGRVIYYGDDEGLRNFVVLNPEWLTKAISYVLEDEPTWEAGGILEHARLKEIWQSRRNGPSYPSRYHPYFLRLMEKFDISYRLADDDYRSLVAQITPHERPSLPWDSRTRLPDGIRRLALVCRLSEPVPGLIAWLTVRQHRASTGKHWRSGVFLRHPIAAYASEALLELRTPDQLSVDVRAPSPDYFFNVLRDSIEDLMSRRWPGLSYELLIPCPTLTADGSPCTSLIPMDGLLAYREEGDTHYRCMQCRTKHELSALLTGFSQPVLSLQPELDRLHDKLADVESGVNELKAHAADTADTIRRILQAVTTEITDCPRLFTLTLEKPSGAQRLRVDKRHYRLVLWCEHPGHWHPWRAASYPIEESKEWAIHIAPYATLVFKALQLVAPIASGIAGVVLTADQLKQAQGELQLMTTLVAELPIQQAADQPGFAAEESRHQLTPAEGEAWRAVRVMIFAHDPARSFGGLHRVQASSGDFLWICPEHYADYDPGLPSIPDN